MRPVSALGVLLLIFAVSISHVENKEIEDYCRELDEELKSVNQDYGIEEWPTLVRKKFWLNLAIPLGSGGIARLLGALDTVAHEKPCEETSLEAVATLTSCVYGMDLHWTTLADASKKYAMKCLTSKYFDKMIESVTARSSTKGLEKYMNETLLASYRKNNPDDILVNDEYIYVLKYCNQLSAQHSIIDSIKSHEGGFKDRKSLENHLDNHLFEPCKEHRDHIAGVLNYIDLVAGQQGFEFIGDAIDSMSQKNKDAICRFNMCGQTLYRAGWIRETLIEKLNLD